MSPQTPDCTNAGVASEPPRALLVAKLATRLLVPPPETARVGEAGVAKRSSLVPSLAHYSCVANAIAGSAAAGGR